MLTASSVRFFHPIGDGNIGLGQHELVDDLLSANVAR